MQDALQREGNCNIARNALLYTHDSHKNTDVLRAYPEQSDFTRSQQCANRRAAPVYCSFRRRLRAAFEDPHHPYVGMAFSFLIRLIEGPNSTI